MRFEEAAPDPDAVVRAPSSPGRRSGPGAGSGPVTSRATAWTAAEPSAATTPWTSIPAGSSSARTTSPLCSSARSSLYSSIHAASRARSSSLARVMSHSMPAWANSAVRQRNPSSTCAAGGVGDRRADVAADELGRQQQRRPALDRLALDGVDGVGRPHPVGAGEDAEVDPGAARRARLDLQTGVGRPQPVEQRVHRRGLPVRRGRARRRRPASLRSRLWSHLRKSSRYSVTRASRRSKRCSATSGSATSSTCW